MITKEEIRIKKKPKTNTTKDNIISTQTLIMRLNNKLSAKTVTQSLRNPEEYHSLNCSLFGFLLIRSLLLLYYSGLRVNYATNSWPPSETIISFIYFSWGKLFSAFLLVVYSMKLISDQQKEELKHSLCNAGLISNSSFFLKYKVLLIFFRILCWINQNFFL